MRCRSTCDGPAEQVSSFVAKGFQLTRPYIVLSENELMRLAKVKRLKAAVLKKLHSMVVPCENESGCETVFCFRHPDRPFREAAGVIDFGERCSWQELAVDEHFFKDQSEQFMDVATKRRRGESSELDFNGNSKLRLKCLKAIVSDLRQDLSGDEDDDASDDAALQHLARDHREPKIGQPGMSDPSMSPVPESGADAVGSGVHPATPVKPEHAFSGEGQREEGPSLESPADQAHAAPCGLRGLASWGSVRSMDNLSFHDGSDGDAANSGDDSDIDSEDGEGRCQF
jgi:hypothetical protein